MALGGRGQQAWWTVGNPRGALWECLSGPRQPLCSSCLPLPLSSTFVLWYFLPTQVLWVILLCPKATIPSCRSRPSSKGVFIRFLSGMWRVPAAGVPTPEDIRLQAQLPFWACHGLHGGEGAAWLERLGLGLVGWVVPATRCGVGVVLVGSGSRKGSLCCWGKGTLDS